MILDYQTFVRPKTELSLQLQFDYVSVLNQLLPDFDIMNKFYYANSLYNIIC